MTNVRTVKCDPQKHARDAQRRDHFDRRIEHGLVINRAFVRVAIGLVDHVELGLRGAFATVRLHHRHAVHLLAQERVEARRLRADVAVRFARALAHERDDEEHDGHGREGDERHLPIEKRHRDDVTSERDDVAERVGDALREELAERVDVVRRARDESPDGRLVEEAQRESLEISKHRLAQVGHRARAGDLHLVDLHEAEHLREEDETREQEAVAEETIAIVIGRVVHDVAHHERAHEVEPADDEQHQERHDEVARVRLDERPEPLQEARVVRFAERAFFVERAEARLGRRCLRCLRGHSATSAASCSSSSSSRAARCSSANVA